MSAPSFLRQTRKVVCIGRNYLDHVKELGNATPEFPFFFLKPTSSILPQNEGPILRPKGVKLHYELELALVIGEKLKNIEPGTLTKEKAIDSLQGYALALDLTARNVQDQAKKKGLPWSAAKGFDTFLPISDLIPKSSLPDPDNAHLQLKVNDEIRQSDSTNLMIFKIPELLTTISNVMTLEPGDIVLTGTPKGVGEIKPGDQLSGSLSYENKVIGTLEKGVEENPSFYEFRG